MADAADRAAAVLAGGLILHEQILCEAMRVLLVELLLFGVGLFGGGCSSADVVPADALHVLFVGNSLTYTNDLPGVVAAFGAAGGVPIVVGSVVRAGSSLEDHWVRGEVREVLASGAWDVVVVQQGPSSLPENQEHLRHWVVRIADEAQAHGTAAAVYQVWPPADRDFAFPAVVMAYANAAAAADATLLPAGAAWLEAWKRQPRAELYGPDGFHPSAAGTYLAALVVYGGLTGAPLDSLPARVSLGGGGRIAVSESQARLMQAAATSVIVEGQGKGRVERRRR